MWKWLGQSQGRYTALHGAHFGSGYTQNGEETLNPPACDTSGFENRPCMQFRATLGIPYQFEENALDASGDPGVVAGRGVHTPVADAGKVQVNGTGPNDPNFPRVENLDLYYMDRQKATSTPVTWP